MKYIDYDWDCSSEGIILDAEFNSDRLGWKHGDYFRFENRNGQQVLVKVDPLIKFLRNGQKDVQEK